MEAGQGAYEIENDYGSAINQYFCSDEQMEKGWGMDSPLLNLEPLAYRPFDEEFDHVCRTHDDCNEN